MRININESGISFNRDSGNSAVLDESVLKEIEERLQNINNKVEYSDKIPTDEDIVIWINPEEDPSQEYLIRINDETIASNTVWSSEKVNNVINEIFIQADSHIHLNKDVLDKITASDIDKWNNKSDFNGSYRSLTDKPYIPSIEGLASEEYVDNAIENLQLPSNLATIEDIPTKVSELTNDNGYITDTELEEELDSKGYLTEHQDLSHLALKEELFNKDYNSLINKPNIPKSTSELINDSGFLSEIPSEYITEEELNNKGYLTEHQDLSEYAKIIDVPTKVSDLANDSNFATFNDLHGHTNKDVIDSITSEKIAQWENHFSGDYNDLTNKPKNLVTQGELESKGYATKEELDDINTVVSSDTEPTDENVVLWVNTSENAIIESSFINDDIVSNNSTWSSEKILEQYNLLLKQYNLLLERITILEESNKEENIKIALVDEGKVDQCIVGEDDDNENIKIALIDEGKVDQCIVY